MVRPLAAGTVQVIVAEASAAVAVTLVGALGTAAVLMAVTLGVAS
jgi:hypothetical protein